VVGLHVDVLVEGGIIVPGIKVHGREVLVLTHEIPVRTVNPAGFILKYIRTMQPECGERCSKHTK